PAGERRVRLHLGAAATSHPRAQPGILSEHRPPSAMRRLLPARKPRLREQPPRANSAAAPRLIPARPYVPPDETQLLLSRGKSRRLSGLPLPVCAHPSLQSAIPTGG